VPDVCGHYEKLWKRSNRPFAELVKLHIPEPVNHGWDPEPPQFVRFDAFQKAQPRLFPPKPCTCGSGDRWKCWHRVKAELLLGEGRVSWEPW
jgi:hypothetical protein